MKFDVMWRFWWKDEDMPIIECSAESMDNGSMGVLFVKAVMLMGVARKYKGIPYSDCPTPSKYLFRERLSFSLLFPSYDCANKFLKYLDQLEHI